MGLALVSRRDVTPPPPKTRPHQCSECETWHYPGRTVPEADPALGNAVPRCRTCGSPKDVLTFSLQLHGKPVGVYRICGACYYAANPIDPRAGDPLAA